ncbi:MAG TPA: HlyD family efflux transporter periplasmic adaptor subunit [Alphaproteobacteria bacterium]|jgi:HlyD family secretion protein|nr:HlyD family efflux transporter periplasmic adaptor subunit [Alphaproteobacteria bacterium]
MEIFTQVWQWIMAMLVAVGIAGTRDDAVGRYQGYIEGDYLRIAAPVSGTLISLSVNKGDAIVAGAPLYVLDDAKEMADVAQRRAQLAQALAHLANLQKGQRPLELQAIEAQGMQAEATLRLSASTLKRQEHLFASKVIAAERLDEARAAYERDRARVAELAALLATAKLAARDDEIRAAEAAVDTARAALSETEWQLSQRRANAPATARVTETPYRVGEFVRAGATIVELLPPANVKARFFVPERQFGTIRLDQEAHIACDGCGETITARVTFIASRAEFTPPVIFSQETRQKLVFMVEATPIDGPGPLNPGQPVDVKLGAR